MKQLALISLLSLLPACDWFEKVKTIKGSGIKARQERPIKDVDELKVTGSGKVILKQGATESLVIEADDNILPHIISEVDDGELFIHPERNTNLRSKSGIVYYFTLKQIEEIKLSGAVELESSLIEAKKLEFELAGATKVKARIKTDIVEIEGSGASKLYLEGETNRQKAEISGSVHYDAGSLKSDSAEIEASGASRVTIAVRKQLEIEASGVAVVSYKGDPEVTIDSAGAASVQKVG